MTYEDIIPLVNQFNARIANINLDFKRYLYDRIDWNDRLIGIKGFRGVGKTTLILQHIKENFADNTQLVFYASLDDIWFRKHSLTELAEFLYTHNYTHLYLDEVHKYPDWALSIKNIYDIYPSLNIVYTGSSMLEIDNSKADLSRRQTIYSLIGLSFREYLEYMDILKTKPIEIEELVLSHQNIAMKITSKVKVLAFFDKYLKTGYYPFCKNTSSEITYYAKLKEVINQVVESDLLAIEDVSYSTTLKIKQLLMAIAPNVPLVPNFSKLSQQLETNHQQCLKLLYQLDKAKILQIFTKQQKSYKHLSKPEKIFLDNSNLLYAISDHVDIGTCRETFVACQLANVGEITMPAKGDFMLDKKILIEVGGKGKDFSQIANEPNSYLALADVEVGIGNRIPLWMFGMLY